MIWASRLLHFAAAVAGLLILIVSGAAIYLKTNPLDLSELRNEIAAELQAATGRDIKITGKIILGVSVTPTLEVAGLQIANYKWGKATNFVTVGAAKIRVHLYPLLRGRVDVISITADRAVVHLETDGDVKRNWNVLASAVTNQGEEAAIPEIGEIKVSDIAIDYRDIRDPKPRYSLHLEKAELIHDTVNGIGSYEVIARLNNNDIEAKGKVAPLYTVSPEQPRQFDMKAQAFGLSLTAIGSVKFPFKEFTYADFTLNSPKGFQPMTEYFGVAGPDIGKIKIEGNLTPVGRDLHFGNLLAQLGDSDASGYIIVGMNAPLHVTSELKSKVFDVAPYWNFLPESPPPPPGKVFPSNPIKLELPDVAQLQLRFAAQSILIGGEEFSNFLLDGKLSDNVLRFTHLDLDVAKGRVATNMTVTPQRETLRLSFHTQASDIDLAGLLNENDMPKYAKGKVGVLFEGKSSGDTVAALAAGMRGRAFFELQEGAIPLRLSSLLRGGITDVLRSIEGMFNGEGKDAKIDCGFGAFVINDGVAQSKALLLMTNKAVVTGDGHIDLGEERLRFRLSPRPRDESMISLASDVDISGTLAFPEFHLNKSSVAKNVGKTAIGMALGPLGMLLGAAGSIISKPGQSGTDKQCAATRTAAFDALQNTGPWPELNALDAAH